MKKAVLTGINSIEIIDVWKPVIQKENEVKCLANSLTENVEEAILLLTELNDLKSNLFKFDHMKRLAVGEKDLEFRIRQHALQFEQDVKLQWEKTVRNYIVGALVFVLVVLSLILFILW